MPISRYPKRQTRQPKPVYVPDESNLVDDFESDDYNSDEPNTDDISIGSDSEEQAEDYLDEEDQEELADGNYLIQVENGSVKRARELDGLVEMERIKKPK